MAKRKCPGATLIFRDKNAKCPQGCKKYIYEYWWADPVRKARNNPNEICTKRWFKVYQVGKGPMPPAHENCQCERRFAFFVCMPPTLKPPVFSRRWDPKKKKFREGGPP